MKEIILECPIIHDEYTELANKMYDVPKNNISKVIIKNNIVLPDEYNIGLIYGASGSGKSTLLKSLGNIENPKWDDLPIISNFKHVSPEEASQVLCAVGLSSIPAWLRPYNCLSNGEKFRADLAKILSLNKNKTILIDEFTSVVDRNVAKSASFALSKYAKKNNLKIILASCHSDIIEWLNPNWIYNPTEGIMHEYPRGSLQRPKIELKIFRTKYEAWELFKHHHYLTADLNKSARCFLVTWNDTPVAFTAILSLPHPDLKNAWRESRTVVLPDYQGLGIGAKLGDYFGSLIKKGNGRFYSRTTHPAIIAHRKKSPENWKVNKIGKSNTHGKSTKRQSWTPDQRECYSFEYIGKECLAEEESLIFWKTT